MWSDAPFVFSFIILAHDNFLDTLPSLKQMGFLDTSARNPDITIVGITLAFQFGNALPICMKSFFLFVILIQN